jgi:hypothetical protein
MLARMRGLKRKLNACAEEETRLHKQTQSRIRHLGELYTMQSLDDVKYEEWSRTRLDRLLVDHLLRYGYKDSAQALSKEKGIEDLVDVETFVQMSRIRESLRSGRVTEALAWCTENKKELRRMESNLEFMLRFQQYIELVRTQDQSKLLESIAHAKKYLLPFKDSYPKEVQQACGLLAFPPGTRAAAYGVSLPLLLSLIILTFGRNFTANPVGQPSQTSSCKRITASSAFPPYHFYTSPSQQVCLPSKPHLVTPYTAPLYLQPRSLQSPPRSVPSAAPNSTISLETSLTHIIPKAMSRATWSSCRTVVCMENTGSRSIAGRRACLRTRSRI